MTMGISSPRIKKAWISYCFKAMAVLIVIIVTFIAFASRFSIAIDPQLVRCIPGYTIYLVDRRNTELVRGNLYMFFSKNLSPIYEEGTRMLKYLRALPGDEIEIRSNDQIFINGNASEWGLSLAAKKLGRSASDYHGKLTLVDNQYWFLGTSTGSFDSRYWGSVKRENIIGRAYPLL